MPCLEQANSELGVNGGKAGEVWRTGCGKDVGAAREEAVKTTRHREHPMAAGAIANDLEGVSYVSRYVHQAAGRDVLPLAINPEAVVTLDNQEQLFLSRLDVRWNTAAGGTVAIPTVSAPPLCSEVS